MASRAKVRAKQRKKKAAVKRKKVDEKKSERTKKGARTKAAQALKRVSEDTPSVAGIGNVALRKRIVSKIERAVEAPAAEWVPSSTKEVNFDHDLAIDYLELAELGVERTVSDRHVAVLTEEIGEGRFLWHIAGLSIAKCGWDGLERKLNGQHTAWARLAFPGDYLPKITVDRYVVNTEDEYRELYSRFDRGKPRTGAHIVQVNLANTPEYEGVSKTVLKKLVAGFKLWRESDSTMDVRNAEKVAAYLRSRKWANIAMHVCRQVAKALRQQETKRNLALAPVVMAMLETYKTSVLKSDAFWNTIISGVDFTGRDDPAKKARDYLMVKVLPGGGMNKATDSSNIVTRSDMFNTLVTLYNDHKNGKTRKAFPRVSAMKTLVTAKR